MIKTETHFHAFGGSDCADGNNQTAVDKYLQKGYGAIVATTHYSKYAYDNYPQKTHKEKIDYFFKVYDDFASMANKNSIKTFFGAEIRCADCNTEFSVIGFDREFLYNNPPLFNLTQEQLFLLCEKNGFFMYQTHPFRSGVIAGNPKFLHGAESYNGHFVYEGGNDLADKWCDENNLIKMSGTDYHHDYQPITAGIYIPFDIENEKQLAKFLLKGNLHLIKDEDLRRCEYVKYYQREDYLK